MQRPSTLHANCAPFLGRLPQNWAEFRAKTLPEYGGAAQFNKKAAQIITVFRKKTAPHFMRFSSRLGPKKPTI